MAAAVSGGAAVGGRNPSGGGGPRLRSPPGKGNKPAALGDITNTGRPTVSRSVGDVVKENAKLLHLLTEKSKIIDLSRVEIQKLRLLLQASRQQNQQLAQANSQMLGELNTGKDRIKELQHELSCATGLLKVKDSELEEVLKAMPSKVAAVKARHIHGAVTSGVESKSSVPSDTVYQESAQDKTRKRNKRKSGSSECIKDTTMMQEHYKPNLQPIMSLDREEPRKPQRRRSSRLNQVSCEITEVSHRALHEDTVDPSAPSTLSIQEKHGPTTGKDLGKSQQNECSAIVNGVLISSEVEEIEINEQLQKEANLKEIQKVCSRAAGVEAHQIDVNPCNTKKSHWAGQSSVPFNTTETPKPPEDIGNKRNSNKQRLALCEAGKAVEDVNPKSDIISSAPLPQEKKRKSQRRQSSRLNSVSSEDINNTFETLHEDVIAPLASSSSNASMEQKTNQKQNDARSSMTFTEGQVAGRRSLRRAAEKVVSYKEIPLNVKMRRP